MIRSSPTGSSQILETSSLSATMQVGCGRSYAIFIYTHAGTFANIDTGNLRAPLLTKACWQSIQGETLHYRHYIFHLGPVLGYIYIYTAVASVLVCLLLNNVSHDARKQIIDVPVKMTRIKPEKVKYVVDESKHFSLWLMQMANER